MANDVRNDKLSMVTKVYETQDYSKFKIMKSGNRDISRAHVDEFKRQITERKFIRDFSIKINSNFEIIEGQHRFIACQELGIPVYYSFAQDFGKKDIEAINTFVKKWTNVDYMNKYAAGGNEYYQRIKTIVDTTGCPPAVTLLIIRQVCGEIKNADGVSTCDKKRFNVGGFEFPLEKEDKIIQRMKLIHDLSQYTTKPGVYDSELVYAVDAMISSGHYDHKCMMSKLKTSKKVPVYGKKITLIREFQKIFNFRLPEDEKVNLMPADIAIRFATM